jgi:fructose-bisphosphate aldolase class II
MSSGRNRFGFADTRGMFERAFEGRYAVPAFNFVCLEQMLSILRACTASRSPFILQCSARVRESLGHAMVVRMAQGCVETMERDGKPVPMALHLDHGMSEADCESCIEDGFSSVMIDGSSLPYERNVELTAAVVRYAHARGVTVEGELGMLAGTEEGEAVAAARHTDPQTVVDFVRRTGVDSLAVSVGTSHGIVKLRASEGQPVQVLRFDILEAIDKVLPGFPLVLHGASALLPRYVETINRYGGGITEARGIPEDQTARAARSAVRKVNIASDGWIAMTAAVRKALAENPAAIDPRVYLSAATREMQELYVHKIIHIMGSAGKAP